MTVSNKRPYIIASIITGVLLIPLIAMQFTTEVNWNLIDFVVAAILLFGTGFILELALRIVKKRTHRIAAGLVILFALAIVWAELAVGLFGTPWAGS